MIRYVLPTATLVLMATPGLAQPANLHPTRDVTVTYQLVGMPGAPAQNTRMAFSAGTGRQRVNPPGGMGWVLVDRKANTAVMVMDAQRAVMTLPPQMVGAMTQDLPPGASFKSVGTSTVAGTSCTEWEVTAGAAHGKSCITDDGVLLRAITAAPNGAALTMEATNVAYGPVDTARLEVPAGYTPMQMPAGMPGQPPTR